MEPDPDGDLTYEDLVAFLWLIVLGLVILDLALLSYRY